MKRSTRLALTMCAIAGALVAAGSAAAVPRLTVSSPERFALGGSTVLIHFTEETTDAAPAKVTIYAPEGYTANGAAVGQSIGSFHANMQTLATSPQAMTSITGDITSEDPAKYAGNRCAAGAGSTGSQRYVWLLHMTVAGHALNVPVFVDTPVPASDPFAGNSQVRLMFCLASPYAEAGSARAPDGVKLTNLAVTLNPDLVVNPSTRGLYAWRTFVTPYKANSGTIDSAGTVEARALVYMPKRITFSAKVVTKRQHVKVHGKRRVRVTNWAVVSGRLLEGIQGVTAKVAILSGPNGARLILRGTTRTNAGGAYTLRIRLKSRSIFQARVDLPNRDVTSRYCATSARGIPCVSATAPAFTILSDAVTLRPRRK
jgi:hypothetical protein